MKPFSTQLREKVIVFDGAMGTNLQSQALTADDFHGEQYNGCNEYLVVSKPEAVRRVHAEFLEAGADVIETDTFGGTPVVLAEYQLADQAYKLNLEAARVAREVASGFSTSDRPRYVAGSMGPTTKLPSLGHISFKEMETGYYTQAKGLVDGGVDLLVIETCQDILQTKAAIAGVEQSFRDSGKKVPLILSVTIETTGSMLLGTEISAALTTLEPFDVVALGMNCATGPKEMSENVRYLCQNSPKPVFVMPNAGIPENIGGHARYRLTPEDLAHYLGHFVRDIGVSIVGGCCGTTREHIRLLANTVGDLSPKERSWSFTPGVSSLYQSVPMHVEPAPVLVGERTNANGSKQFRELLAKDEWEGMVGMAKQQAKEGAHILDVCVAYVGRNESADMREVVSRYNTQVTTPLMIDSTEPPVIEQALQRIGGRAIVNSVNLEDGEKRLSEVLGLCKRYGAAVVALTIDEQGMAKSVERKIEIARRIHELATKKYGLEEKDLIFDALTFTLASGDEEFRKSAIATLGAVRRIKELFPGVWTSLGVSNVSFGLAPYPRHVLNSVFLHHAIGHGLDMAIVHASKIMPLYKLSDEEQKLAHALVFDERDGGGDPLQNFLAFFSEKKAGPKAAAPRPANVEERLKRRIIDGDKVGLQADLDEALKSHPALEIINTHLLDGMKVVGELFGSGQMQLPFVLQSAEVMKSAVSYLEKFMDKDASASKGTLVIATVKGDVHDIGKNLVDIILTNNGYKVVNLGIQCPLDRMLSAFEEHTADAIGMSGLLVKSTLVMKENLEVMTERGLLPPVILGGAALTRRYVEQDLRAVYGGALEYANDAFDGLRFMERLMQEQGSEAAQPRVRTADPAGRANGAATSGGQRAAPAVAVEVRSSSVPHDNQIPVPPFYGTKIVADIPLNEIFPFVNEVALYRGQWQVRKGSLSDEDYRKMVERDIVPERRKLEASVVEQSLLKPAVIYGYYPCQADGNDLILYRRTDGRNPLEPWNPAEAADGMLEEWIRFTFPRQRADRSLCIADFFLPRASGRFDVAGVQLVTMGSVASEYSRSLFAEHRYKEYLFFHGLSVETAEALAELWHKRVREELGIARQDAAEIKKLFSQQYQGSRYSFGYPACPNLEDQTKMMALLGPGRIGVTLTEEYQLVPEQSTSALIVHHPAAKYFTI